jgi:hypothetical protein
MRMPCCASVRQDVFVQAGALDGDHPPRGAGDEAQLHFGRPAVQGEVGHARRALAFEAADALAEILVQVAGGDGDKLQPLQQRRAPVDRLVQHAPVEVEPAQLAVVDLVKIADGVQRQGRQIEAGRISRVLRQGAAALPFAQKVAVESCQRAGRRHLWRDALFRRNGRKRRRPTLGSVGRGCRLARLARGRRRLLAAVGSAAAHARRRFQRLYCTVGLCTHDLAGLRRGGVVCLHGQLSLPPIGKN